MKINKQKGLIVIAVIIVIILAVGAAAYFFNKKKAINELSMSNSQISPTENSQTQNNSLQNSELKTNYSNQELGISFLYPKEWGGVVFSNQKGKTGYMFSGKFTENNEIAFGGLSKDYTAEGRGAIDFDIKEFNQKGLPIWMDSSFKESVSAVNVSGILYTQQATQQEMFYPVGAMLAYFPLMSEEFKAIGFTGVGISAEEFKEFISSIKVTNLQKTATTITGDSSNSNQAIFTSYRLGIIYKYPKTIQYPVLGSPLAKVVIAEDSSNNKLYIGINNDLNAYFSEFFTKNNNTTFVEDIRNRFIKDTGNCIVVSYIPNYYTIKYVGKPLENIYDEKAVCGYYAQNGAFAVDPSSNRYFFIESSGQEPYFGSGEVLNFWPPKVGVNLEFINKE